MYAVSGEVYAGRGPVISGDANWAQTFKMLGSFSSKLFPFPTLLLTASLWCVEFLGNTRGQTATYTPYI